MSGTMCGDFRSPVKKTDKLRQSLNACFEMSNTVTREDSQRLEYILRQLEMMHNQITNVLQSSEPISTGIDCSSQEINTQCATTEKSEVSKVTAASTSTEGLDVKKPIKLTSEEKREIVHQYGKVLGDATNLDYGSSIASQCIALINRWFQARIFTQYDNAPPFTYNVSFFPSAIYAFVLAFGYHYQHDTMRQFMSNFDSWEKSLSTSAKSNKWFTPYEIHQISVNLDLKYVTVTAPVIYDLLIGHPDGICNLFKVSQYSKINLRRHEILDRIGELIGEGPELDGYVPCYEDSSIIKSLRLE